MRYGDAPSGCAMPDCKCSEAIREIEHLRNVLEILAGRLGFEICRNCDGWGRIVGSYGYIESCRNVDCEKGVVKKPPT